MYLKFLFGDGQLPKEFGEDLSNCIYYSDELKISSTNSEERIDFFGPFSIINLFVGTNNSGKSRFLRGLLQSDRLNYEISSEKKSIEDLFNEVEEWGSKSISEINRLDYQVSGGDGTNYTKS
ncbi:hypothetical protein CLV81_0791 [Flagellimonas meridianipacifica]|uniref:Uncharacterized protein n=2 Tax=Flagellimonas meridianipacifica TaxID=1080225 RepID=A0A2T0MGU3_9FLAO|nr:hypothetical protein CLV81_0791 [Allomuricauda pacifica]